MSYNEKRKLYISSTEVKQKWTKLCKLNSSKNKPFKIEHNLSHLKIFISSCLIRISMFALLNIFVFHWWMYLVLLRMGSTIPYASFQFIIGGKLTYNKSKFHFDGITNSDLLMDVVKKYFYCYFAFYFLLIFGKMESSYHP